MPGENNLPLFAVEYNGRRVGIRRTADYDEVINSVRKALPELSEISEIGRELWKDVSPLVKTMQIVVANVDPKALATKKRKFPPGAVAYRALGQSDLHAQRTDGNPPEGAVLADRLVEDRTFPSANPSNPVKALMEMLSMDL